MKKKPHPHPHPIHSGIIFEGDTHYHTHNHLDAGAQNALQTCLHAIRGLATKADREAVLGHLLAALVHGGDIDGLLRVYSRAMLGIDHYNVQIETRHH